MAAVDRTTAKPRRRILRIVALALSAVLVLGAIAVAAYVRSGDRVVAFLAGVLQRDYLIDLKLGAPAEIAWWPQVALRLRDVSLESPGAGKPLLIVDELRVRATWASLFGGEVELTELDFDRPTVDADAVAAWSMRYTAQLEGPLPPLRVPTITTAIRVRDLSVAFADGAVHRFPHVGISPVSRGRPVSVDARWAKPGATSDWAISLDTSVDDTPTGLVFRKLEFAVRDGANAPQLIATGEAQYDAATAWRFDGTLGGALLAAAGVDDDAMPVKIARAASPALAIVAKGIRGGAAFDVDLSFAVMPDTSQPPDQLLATFTDHASGTARIDRLTVGEWQLEGVEFRAGDAVEVAVETKPIEKKAENPLETPR